ncbi:MAG TPA: hypothetical protein VI424_15910 [Terriglobales bacterium]
MDKKYPAFHFACPVCLHVNRYTRNDLRKVRFFSPDPYKAGKLVLYSARFGCSHPHCAAERVIFTVAAAKVSVVILLQFWKMWKVKFSCIGKHPFRMRNPRMWWIQQEKSFTKAIR